MTRRRHHRLDVDALGDGVLAGQRAVIARAITLVESRRVDDRGSAGELLSRLQPHSGNAIRLGITGVPGVGKSTFIDELGTRLTGSGLRVAVLAVDPSSTRTKGSVLGDKTRMERLAAEERAFIRPSPSAGTLGGVARSTREAMVVLEAAGYDVVLVETVGVGQSEVAVAQMVDTFLLLALARSGDQLQGIKKGILELADVIAVNKADGDHASEARQAARELSGALRMVARLEASSWRVPVLTCSSLTGDGIDDVWQTVRDHRTWLEESGQLEARRAEQRVAWMWDSVHDRLVSEFTARQAVQDAVPALTEQVRAGTLAPSDAAERLLRL